MSVSGRLSAGTEIPVVLVEAGGEVSGSRIHHERRSLWNIRNHGRPNGQLSFSLIFPTSLPCSFMLDWLPGHDRNRTAKVPVLCVHPAPSSTGRVKPQIAGPQATIICEEEKQVHLEMK